jgi:class 3 adenylate cyclase/TolB-like protein
MTEQRRLAAIVAADMVGFSRRMERDERGTLTALKALRRDRIDPAIAAHGGRIVKTTGDGLLLEFPSVIAAVTCAVGLQTAMADRNASVADDDRVDFRIGVHLGDIMVDDGDIFGDGVNVAARLESMAPPGGILVSQSVIDSIGSNVPATFVDAGVRHLKNIAQPVRTHRWLPKGYAAKPASASRAAVAPSALVRWTIGVLLAVAIGAAGFWLAGRLSPGSSVVAPAPTAGETPATAAEAQRASVAVLPFRNLSGDPSQEYFADGVTEDVISALGRFPSLTVMSRGAVFPYKGRSIKPADIGRDLGVRYLVEASVRRDSDRIRVQAELSDSASGTLLWSQTYDVAPRDVFTVQDEIARSVGGALAVTLTRVEQQRALAKAPHNLDAYDLVLRGRERLWLATRAGNREARRLFEQAIDRDPTYAAAYAWLGRAMVEVANHGWTEDPAQAVERALELGRTALSLDPDHVEALGFVGAAHTLRSEHDQALAASERLLAINPSDADGMVGRLGVLVWSGRIDEAVAAGEAALRLDPNARAGTVFALAMAYYQARRHAEAIRLLEPGVARFPDAAFLHALAAAAYARMGRAEDAAQALQTLRRLDPFFDIDTFGSRFRDPERQDYLREGIVEAGWR